MAPSRTSRPAMECPAGHSTMARSMTEPMSYGSSTNRVERWRCRRSHTCTRSRRAGVEDELKSRHGVRSLAFARWMRSGRRDAEEERVGGSLVLRLRCRRSSRSKCARPPLVDGSEWSPSGGACARARGRHCRQADALGRPAAMPKRVRWLRSVNDHSKQHAHRGGRPRLLLRGSERRFRCGASPRAIGERTVLEQRG